MTDKTHHSEHNFKEASYIQHPDCNRAEKSRGRKRLRTYSSVAILLCFTCLFLLGLHLNSATPNAYAITVDGKSVAMLTSRVEAQDAIDLCLAEEKESYQTEADYSVHYTNSVDIEEISSAKVAYASVGEAAEILSGQLNLVADAVAIYVDGKDVFCVASEEDAIEVVNQAKTHYGSPKEENIDRVYTIEQVSMHKVTACRDTVYSVEEGANMLLYGSSEVVTADTAKPLITVKVERREVREEPLRYETIRVDNPDMMRGEESVVTAGTDGIQATTRKLTEENGIVVSEENIGTEVLVPATDEVIEVGTMLMISSRGMNGNGVLGWPLADGVGTISSRFGWRSRGWHSGVDIANPVGTPIYAVEEGTVTFCDYMSGYGLVVMIDHGNGVETRYAHCDAATVTTGQSVARGDGIATIGMTGTTTGPHVHFEVRVDGIAVDPLPYIE